MSIINDIWGNEVIITKDYVSHRNRLIDIHLIGTFQSKGKRVYINTFKQNTCVPTMCIFFENKEKAQETYELMREMYYGPLPRLPQDARKQKGAQPELSTSQMLLIFLVTFSPLLVFAFVMLLFSFVPLATATPLFLGS